ncbi:FAD dependent oxidoreductase [Podospora didyma]|uniref:FAD dependent oxidoreductase n=1 Tax=Podospora didyma TaxID=330526 RepID=A0AAE0N761_9PEZI|nr:FAD dependent oxidoreductase [Podospora didyma]
MSNSHNPEDTILVVGAGIVGSALAYFLSLPDADANTKRSKIIVFDRSLDPLVGSTGHAPGFIGQFNQSAALTQLAVDSVAEYAKIPGGFDSVGGLEIATSAEAVKKLESRLKTAVGLGLPAEMITMQRAAELAPKLVKPSNEGAALHFPTDGTADAGRITSYYREEAQKQGVQFVQGEVVELLTANGRATGVVVPTPSSDQSAPPVDKTFLANKVAITTGIWAQDLLDRDVVGYPVPVVPVAHPYAYSQPKEPSKSKMPFVRWPEHHVYARDHGDRYGLGTYDHKATTYTPENDTAIGDWLDNFDVPLESAKELLPASTSALFTPASKKFNGIFSMTPDNMPIICETALVSGLFMAVAVWVTHAAGTAKYLAKVIQGAPDLGDKYFDVWDSTNPSRFNGKTYKDLEERCLRGYNNIYATK